MAEVRACANVMAHTGLPHPLRQNVSSVFDPAHDSIKVMTLHVSRGLAFPVVALVGAGRMPAEGEDEREEARLFFVGATPATQRFVIGVSKLFARLYAESKTLLDACEAPVPRIPILRCSLLC